MIGASHTGQLSPSDNKNNDNNQHVLLSSGDGSDAFCILTHLICTTLWGRTVLIL